MKKKSFLSVAVIFFIVRATAQNIIPNPGFENWIPNAGYDDPEGWGTLNVVSLLGNPVSVFKDSITPYAGSYAMKITTIVLSSNPDSTQLRDTSGLAFTGNVSFSGFVLGYPYNLKPANLNFYYKYNPSGIDSAYCAVQLFKWDSISGTRDTIASGLFKTILNSNTYSLATLPLNYNPLFTSLTPDTALINFSASNDVTPQAGSILYVDELSFTGGNVGIYENFGDNKGILVFPNPAKNEVNFLLDGGNFSSIEVFETTGKKICSAPVKNKAATIDVRSFKNGQYLYRITDHKNSVVKTGVFNTIK